MATDRLARTLARCIDATPAWRGLLALLLVAVAVLALSPEPPRELDTGWDLSNHALAFCALGFAACLARPGPLRRMLPALAGVLAFGVLIELLQLVIPGRQGEWRDLAADAVGLAIGTGFALLALRTARAAAARR